MGNWDDELMYIPLSFSHCGKVAYRSLLPKSRKIYASADARFG